MTTAADHDDDHRPAPVVVSSVDLRPLDDLHPHPDNPRQGDIGAISESLRVNGQYAPIIATPDGTVLAGSHRLAAARALGWTEMLVATVDVDDVAARRILLADNRTSDLATYDDNELLALLSGLATDDQLDGTGWDGDDLDELLQQLEVPEFRPTSEDQPRLDQRNPIECPSCGHRWRVGPKGEIEEA